MPSPVPTSAPSKAHRRHPVALLASVGGLGYLPLAPGTWGSLAGLPVAYGLAQVQFATEVAALCLLTAVAVWVAAKAEHLFATHDASYVVLDEVVGMAIALVAIPTTLGWYAAAFGLFRLFDAAKPGPIGWLDRHVQGGFGVVVDDVAAGLLALAVLHLARLNFW